MGSIDLVLQSILNAHSEHDREYAGARLSTHVRQLEHELTFTKNALCDLIEILHKNNAMTPELQAILDRYDAELSRRAHVDTRAEVIVDKVNAFLAEGKDIEAVRCYHSEAGAIWDRCHDVIGAWPMMNQGAKHHAVQTDLDRKAARTQPTELKS